MLSIENIELSVSIVSHCTKITFFQVVSVEIISIVIFNSVYSIMVLSVNVEGNFFLNQTESIKIQSDYFRPDKRLVSNIMLRRSDTIENELSPKRYT